MTRFTVLWLKEVKHDLAEIWMAHHDRESVAEAANLIDASLASDPWKQGGELKEGIRFFLAHRYASCIQSRKQIASSRLS
jgi:hypothetical protein